MSKKSVIALLLLLALAAVTVLYLRFRSDEYKIRRTLVAFTMHANKPNGESPAGGVLKASGLDKFIAPKLCFSSDAPEMEREIALPELKVLFIQYRNLCDTLSVDLEIVKVTLAADRATAECNLAVTGHARGDAEKFTGLRRATFELVKIDGKWKIVRCALSAPLDSR